MDQVDDPRPGWSDRQKHPELQVVEAGLLECHPQRAVMNVFIGQQGTRRQAARQRAADRTRTVGTVGAQPGDERRYLIDCRHE